MFKSTSWWWWWCWWWVSRARRGGGGDGHGHEWGEAGLELYLIWILEKGFGFLGGEERWVLIFNCGRLHG